MKNSSAWFESVAGAPPISAKMVAAAISTIRSASSKIGATGPVVCFLGSHVAVTRGLIVAGGGRAREGEVGLEVADRHSTEIQLAERLPACADFRVDGSLDETAMVNEVVQWLIEQNREHTI